jgi:hypothetical protein
MILGGGPSAPQLTRLYAIATAHGLDHDDVHELMAQYGAGSSRDLTRENYDDLIASIEGGFKEVA